MYILSGYRYHLSEGPWLQLDDITSQPTTRHHVPIWEQAISIKPLETRYCIGGYDLLTRRSICCPDKCQISGQHPYCFTCSRSIQFNPAFYHVAPSQLSSHQQHYNLEPHTVYLAYFGKNMVKVGIAHTQRLYNRWLEQGARAAVVVQDMQDAYAARSLEAWISANYRIPERVTSGQKQQYLHMPYHFDEASMALRYCLNLISEESDGLSANHPIQDLQAYYFAKKQPSTLYEPTKERQHMIAGLVIGMVGEVLIYKQQGYNFIQPMKQFLGRAQVVFKEASQPLTVNIQTKLDLFG
ncbi:MAG: hypothetical protein BGO68_03355 [Candidatus Amoebophilus sp. 36-38]|mgnify:CR=1 FL=1|nr:MAG: hypothetical protein BGO68_03355 [Candidatus Amoebophilus sp. 36-38]